MLVFYKYEHTNFVPWQFSVRNIGVFPHLLRNTCRTLNSTPPNPNLTL